MNRSLNERHALVTGAGSGIGAAIAMSLAQHGCRLTLAGRSQEALQKASEIALGKQQQAIEPGHLLQGILSTDENVPGYLFKKMNINAKILTIKGRRNVSRLHRLDNIFQFIDSLNEAMDEGVDFFIFLELRCLTAVYSMA